MNINALVADWNRNGFILLRDMLSAQRVHQLRAICEEAYAGWRLRPWPFQWSEPGVSYYGMDHVMYPGFYADPAPRVRELLSTIGDSALLEITDALWGGATIFGDAGFFFEPAVGRLKGNWHRDGGTEDPTRKFVTVQFAFVPSDVFEYVPGTHARPDTPAEHAIRLGNDKKDNRSDHMPRAHRVAMNPGDVVMFHPGGIHRGGYYCDVPRRTLSISYRTPAKKVDKWSFQPWFRDFQRDGYFNHLDTRGRQLFERYIELHDAWWNEQPSDAKVAHV